MPTQDDEVIWAMPANIQMSREAYESLKADGQAVWPQAQRAAYRRWIEAQRLAEAR